MSSSFDEWLSSAHKRYLDSKELSERLSLKDSVEKPYESKYKAKQIINDLLQELIQFESVLTTTDINSQSLLQLLFNYELGSIDLDTEEIGTAQKHFEKCLKLLDHMINDPKVDPNRVRLSLSLFEIVANNQLAYIWCSRAQYECADTYLKSAEKAYKHWEESEEQMKSLLIDFLDVFNSNPLSDNEIERRLKDPENKGLKNIESGYTLTSYLMAQTYEKMGQNSKSAIYCHLTLKRQYKQIEDNCNELYDRIDWSLNAATLSQYFAVNSDFNASRHLICCAFKVISNSTDIESEKYRKGLADINRIVVKYCLMVLDTSAAAIRDNLITESEPNSDVFKPYLLNDSEVEELEKSLKTFPVRDLSEAQQVFKYGTNCLNESISFYTLNERASDYIECIQDKSKLFQYLIPFDADYERQCKMHKRRIDLLEDLLKQISPKHFMGQCRQIMFELAEIYSQMADLKTQIMNEKPPEQHMSAIKKINLLIRKSISNYEDFHKTFDENSKKQLPDVLPEDYVRPILLSLFSIGRLHSKLITLDPREDIKNWMKCEEFYVKVRDYLEKNPNQKNHFEEELPLLEEMLKLIPGKIQMILSQTIY